MYLASNNRRVNSRRASDANLTRLVVLGNCLSIWAGIQAVTPQEQKQLGDLLEAWDAALKDLREEKRNNLLQNPIHSDIL